MEATTLVRVYRLYVGFRVCRKTCEHGESNDETEAIQRKPEDFPTLNPKALTLSYPAL